MKLSTMQLIFVVLFSLIIIVLTSILIESYFFSWTGYLSGKAGFCEYKSISVPADSSGVQKTGFEFDTKYIAAEMRKKGIYEVKEGNERFVVIKRKFGDVTYGMMLHGPPSPNQGFIIFTGLDDNPLVQTPNGESCTTPNRVLRENIYSIIDDLPLNEQQKNEMKGYVQVKNTSVFRFS